MHKPARIYRPAKTAMQSGKAKTQAWVLEFEPGAAKRPDPLMGWAGSADTDGQIRLTFETQELAIGYAIRHGIAFDVAPPKAARVRPKSYADNFKYDRVR
ncbi:MAG: ETC complex I subunit [Tagaea sp.]